MGISMQSKALEKHPQIKAIIFDLDGVLLDSETNHYHSWKHAVEKFGGSLSTREYSQYAGKSGPDMAKLLAEQIHFEYPEKILEEKLKVYFHLLEINGIPPFYSTLDFLHLLAKEKTNRKIYLGIASAAKREEIEYYLKNQNIHHYFDVILSGFDDLAEYNDPEGVNKPKPYVYIHAAKLLSLKTNECVVIEDSFTGISAAVNAGCLTIAAPNEYTQYQDLSLANGRIESFQDMTPKKFFQFLTEIQ